MGYIYNHLYFMGIFGNPRAKKVGIPYNKQKKGCLIMDYILIFMCS